MWINQCGGHCNKWLIITKFQILINWNACNGLLGSAKPGQSELSDWSDIKKTGDGHQGEGCPYWISSGRIVRANYRCYFLCFVWVKIGYNLRTVVKLNIISNALNIYATYAKNTQFHWYPRFTLFSRQNLETSDISYAFLTPNCCKYNTIQDAILMCTRKLTWISLIYRTETTTKKCKREKLKSKNGYAQK